MARTAILLMVFLVSTGICLGLFQLIVHLMKFGVRKGLCSPAVRSRLQFPPLRFGLLWVSLILLLFGSLLGGVILDRPIVGLVILLFLPGCLYVTRTLIQRSIEHNVEKSAVSFLYALNGLLRAGISFPTALFRLSRTVEGPFSSYLSVFLGRYHEGKTLLSCLEHFRKRSGLKLLGFCMSVLEIAYSRGLPMVPFVERLLPLLENEIVSRQKIESLRKSIAFQVGGVSLIPWVLFFALKHFEKGLFTGLWVNPIFLVGVVFVILYEIAGVVVIWKISDFS